MKKQITQQNKEDLLVCLNKIFQQRKGNKGFTYPVEGTSQLRSFLTDNKIPFYQSVESILRKTFVHIKRIGYGALGKTSINWVNPVEPNFKMVDEIFKRSRILKAQANQKARDKAQSEQFQGENSLLNCLAEIYLVNKTGKYFQYTKGSLQVFLKHNDIDNYIDIDRYLRENKIVVNMSTGRQRSEYQWMLDTAPTQELVDKINKAVGLEDINQIHRERKRFSFGKGSDLFNLMELRFYALLPERKFALGVAHSTGKAMRFSLSTTDNLLKKLIKAKKLKRHVDLHDDYSNLFEKTKDISDDKSTEDAIVPKAHVHPQIEIKMPLKTPARQTIDQIGTKIQDNKIEIERLQQENVKYKELIEQLKSLD